MTILNCSATSCMYNRENLCSRGDIQVEGPQSHIAKETCCASFQKRTGSSMTNSCAGGCGCEKIAINCHAKECTYNDNTRCTASAIGITGSGANSQEETMCRTFQGRM